MATVAMPQLGESVTEGTVVRWLKRVGDAVRVDEPLFEVATDKVNTEIPSLEGGVLSEILVAEGQTVPVGTALARIGSAETGAVPATNGSRAGLFSPVVRRLAREHGLDLAHVRGTGGGGRITRADVLAFLASRPPAAAPAASAPLPAAPPASLRGRTVPLSPLRVQIAEHLAAARRNAVDVFTVIEADLERVNAVRAAHKERLAQREGLSLTLLPFVARAVVDALAAYPAVNASLDTEAQTLTHHDAIHLGIAVDLDEEGLIVPVVRDAETLNVLGLARRIRDLASAARARKLAPVDAAGSTFSITNNGAFGTLITAPAINAPNVAILSTDVAEQRPVVVDGAIAIRLRMYLSLSWDHRAFDGSTAGRFLARVKRDLETWDWETQLV